MSEGNYNPLIQDNFVDTMCYVENNLRFINDYFVRSELFADEDPKIMHGICNTLDMSISALRYEIDRTGGKALKLWNVIKDDKG